MVLTEKTTFYMIQMRSKFVGLKVVTKSRFESVGDFC